MKSGNVKYAVFWHDGKSGHLIGIDSTTNRPMIEGWYLAVFDGEGRQAILSGAHTSALLTLNSQADGRN
jgi:hypothetical protein